MVNKTPLYTAIKMASAGAATFIIYTLLHLKFGYWAIISIAAVTQAGLAKTLTKGVVRIIGTLIGASFGYFFAVLAQGNITLVMLLFFIFLTLTSHIALQKNALSYAGTMTGLTMVIVLSSSLMIGELFNTAVYRSVEVLLGIAVVSITNLILWVCVQGSKQSFIEFAGDMKSLPNSIKEFHFNYDTLKLAIKISLACLFTFSIWIYFRQLNGFWATISCLLIMEESLHETQTKSTLRIIAHVIAALYGAIFALLIDQQVWWLLLPLTLSFFFCGYIIGRCDKYSSLGNTMGIAIAIMLLTSPGTESSFAIIASRFLNVMLGVSVGVFITQFLWPKKG